MASEFTAAAASAPRATHFDTRSPGRWIVSHLRCYPVVFVLAIVLQLTSWSLFASMPVMIGRAAQVVIDGLGSRELLLAALRLLGVMAGNSAALIGVMACAASLGHRLQRDARDELYRGLLGKSQTFHNRQRIGDLVARATDDTRLVNEMINPALVYLTDLPIGLRGDADLRDPDRSRAGARAGALRSGVCRRGARSHAPRGSGAGGAAHPVRAPGRGDRRGDHRHRGGQGHRARSLGAAALPRRRRRAPRPDGAPGPDRGAQRGACWRSASRRRWRCCTVSWCCTRAASS